MTKSYPKSLLEVIKVTGDGHCTLHVVREAMRHEKVKGVPSNSELLTMIKFEVLNNLLQQTSMENVSTALILILYTN